MELFLQSAALVLIAVILGLMQSGENKVFLPIVSLAVCCLIFGGLARYLEPVMDLLGELRSMADISGEMLSVLLKAVGISVIAQIAELICADAGQGAMGKAISLLANGVILWLSIPLVEELLELLQEVLGRV